MDDVVVVGGGAAGLNAALVLGRARRSVVVVDSGEPRNAPAEGVHGFLSRDGVPPGELLGVGRDEVARYGGRFVSGRVARVERVEPAREADPEFRVELDGGEVLRSRRVVVATGLRDELPDVPGLREGWGRYVLHCPYCHGFEVADGPLGVLGTHERSPHQALLVREWSSDLVYFAVRPLADGEREALAARGVRVVDGPVSAVSADGVETAAEGLVARRAVFVAPEFRPRDGVLDALGCERDDAGLVRVDAWGATSVPGVYAAGNVVDPMAQVVSSAAAGAKAAVGLHAGLVFGLK
ncbi:NAD(P)/FAD-dependent oxidoreductase [Saccharothrix hoggarensis]|uniref:NAD(P)/FAD-dependent oxidoreductase n=1 Tax=Saccharothrix hoggarensis TaxID=913853 RepID=A0ABW3R4H1_9PSEU